MTALTLVPNSPLLSATHPPGTVFFSAMSLIKLTIPWPAPASSIHQQIVMAYLLSGYKDYQTHTHRLSWRSLLSYRECKTSGQVTITHACQDAQVLCRGVKSMEPDLPGFKFLALILAVWPWPQFPQL